MPTADCLAKAIEMAEQTLAEHEREVAAGPRSREWHFSATELLQEWTDKVSTAGDTFSLFEYQMCFFASEEWKSCKPFAWTLNGHDVRPSLLQRTSWPSTFEPPFPTRHFPLDIRYVLLHATSQLWALQPHKPLSKEFVLLLEHADYLLSLAETEDASCWRSNRPPFLEFPPPPPTTTSPGHTWPQRSYTWPTVTTRGRTPSVSACPYDDSRHLRGQHRLIHCTPQSPMDKECRSASQVTMRRPTSRLVFLLLVH